MRNRLVHWWRASSSRWATALFAVAYVVTLVLGSLTLTAWGLQGFGGRVALGLVVYIALVVVIAIRLFGDRDPRPTRDASHSAGRLRAFLQEDTHA